MNNKEWLGQLAELGGRKMQEIGIEPFVLSVGVSLLCALFISFLYASLYRNRATGSMVHRAFPLLGVSITSIFITVQFSLPLSLGLLGALSIVRFRTPIKEPEEIGFIMLVVATSLCCATFNLLFLGIILGVAVGGLMVQAGLGKFWRLGRRTGTLVVAMNREQFETRGKELFGAVGESWPRARLGSTTRAGEETNVSWEIAGAGEDVALGLSELERRFPGARAQLFCHRVGEP